MANLTAEMLRHGRMEITLAKAKTLRPFAEKRIIIAKKMHWAEDYSRKLSYLPSAIARAKDEDAMAILFNTKTSEFMKK
jgi:ribosomal protein L17